MGNHRFSLSDMMPSTWFYMLKDASRSNRGHSIQRTMKRGYRHTTTSPRPLPRRASSYISTRERTEGFPHSPINHKASDTHFPIGSPSKSKPNTQKGKKWTKPTTKHVSSSSSSAVSARCRSCCCTLSSVCNSGAMHESSSDCDDSDPCKPIIATNSSTSDNNMDMTSKTSSNRFEKFEDLEVLPQLKLRPILTKPIEEVHKDGLQEHNKSTGRRRSVNRAYQTEVEQPSSPRLGAKNLQAYKNQKPAQSKALLESLVVVKSSFDPQSDFRESMVEMIIENNIRAPKDLEELLACYLSLNSRRYHGIILKEFKQICFQFSLR